MTSRFDGSAERFITCGLYLRNWSPRTAHTYRQGLSRLHKFLSDRPLTKAELDAWVISLRASGVTPTGCNMYIRTINSFLTYLHTEGEHPERLRVKLLRTPLLQPTLLTPADIGRLLTHKPATFGAKRAWTLILLLLDTGTQLEFVPATDRHGRHVRTFGRARHSVAQRARSADLAVTAARGVS